MSVTPSTMLPLGTPAPDFSLPDAVSERTLTRDQVRGEAGLLVMFICNHCPFVVHVRPELLRVAADYQPRGVGVVAINSNDADDYSQDGPGHMRRLARSEGWTFPFLFDASQEVAKAYRAACTPDLYLFDRDLALVYRGQLDSARPGNSHPVSGRDLRAALDALLAGRPIDPHQLPATGCNIKWKPGNEPEY